MSLRLLPLALLLAAFPIHAAAATAEPAAGATLPITAEALEARLRRIEQLLGATGDDAEGDGLVALDQRLKIIERKLELQQEDAANKAATVPAVSVGDKGLSVRSADSNYEIKLRGTLQADQRTFIGDETVPQNDTFLFRVIRPTIEGSLGPLVAFRLTPEFAGDNAAIVDAYADLRFDPAYTLRVGKFTSPVGLERLQSTSALPMMERGFPSELAPNRDLGVQLQGELSKGRLSYALGAFNGAPDGRDAPTTDADNDVEFAGRIFFEPWKNDAGVLSGLGFGLGFSIGDKQGNGNNLLPRYRTPGQNVFFAYRATVNADGEQRRLSPQFYYYRNALGLLGEYIRSEQEVALTGDPTSHATLSNRAWQLTGSWVLTGEDAGYRGVVRPTHPFVAGGEGWGAFELVARYGELDVDDGAFPIYANPAVAATEAKAWGLGLNWYLNSNLKLVFNYAQTRFNGGAASGADREDEQIFFSRLQVAF
jgi:phosphate-selective porin OprO/OprP